MRIAIISDIHGNLPALEAVLADIKGQHVDGTICLGDLVVKGPFSSECVARIRESGMPCIYGNTDAYLLEVTEFAGQRPLKVDVQSEKEYVAFLEWHKERLSAAEIAYLAGLPFSHRLEADGQTFLFVHANARDCESSVEVRQSPEERAARLGEFEADFLFMGHIHTPFVIRQGRSVLVNTGAIGFSLDEDWRPSYAILDTARSAVTLQRVSYDVEEAVRAAAERNFYISPENYRKMLLRQA